MTTTTTDTMMNPTFRDVIGMMGDPETPEARGDEDEVTLTDVQGRQDFRLDDVKVGSSWMAGVTTAGRVAVGRVVQVDMGEGFVIRQRSSGGQLSKLWQQLWLLETPAADSDDEMPEEESPARGGRPAVLLRRTDSGLDYRMPGYPDCAWWADNGVTALFIVPAAPSTSLRRAAGGPRDAVAYRCDASRGCENDEVLRLLMEAQDCGRVPSEGAFYEAWSKQMDACHAIRNAGPASMAELQRAQDETPVARQGPAAFVDEMTGVWAADDATNTTPVAESLPPLRMPTVRDHIGAGILPGDFIKPDPHDARATQRRHILQELRTWLTDRLYGSACLASNTDMTEDDIRAAMATGRGWPGGRLWLLLQALDEAQIPLPGVPADTGDRLRLAGVWAADVCEHWLLDGVYPLGEAADLALGFVTRDHLSDGWRTIEDLWPRPEDLSALRDASPLPDPPEEVPHTRTMDTQIDAINNRLGEFLTGDVALEFRVKMPGWAWTALFLTIVGYFWLVAFLLSSGAQRVA